MKNGFYTALGTPYLPDGTLAEEGYRKEIAQYSQQDEDVLSYALFPQVATKFFQWRQAQQLKADPTAFNKADGTMPV